MNWLQLLIFGLLGGAVAEIIALLKYKMVPPDEYPSWLKGPVYWLLAVASIGIGGLTTAGMLPQDVIPLSSFFAAVQVGFAWPALLCVSGRVAAGQSRVGKHD